ncbi:MAG: glycosyltransferase family 4 protein [Planctomycetota bacterium]
MRILIVAGKLTYSNQTTYTIGLIRGLSRRGHEVQIAALGGPLFSQVEGLGAETYLVKFNFFSRRRLLGFLRDFGPDVIHATGGDKAMRIAAGYSRHFGVPLIHTFHSWLPEDRAARLHHSVAGVVAVNQGLREHLVNELNVPKGKIRVIPYGVDGGELPATMSDSEAPGGGGRIPVVGTIGRLRRGRRHDEFLKAARLVHERVKEVHFMIAGDGVDEDRLRRLTRELSLQDAVTFVQPQSGAVNMNSVFDVLVIVSDWGGVGLNLLEGMAQERPVIATGGGEVFSILGKEEVCVLVPPGDTERLAEEIIALLAHPEKRRELGRKGREYVIGHYPLEDQVMRTEDYYGEIAGAPPA